MSILFTRASICGCEVQMNMLNFDFERKCTLKELFLDSWCITSKCLRIFLLSGMLTEKSTIQLDCNTCASSLSKVFDILIDESVS